MNKEEKEAIDMLKRTIKNSNYCDSIGTGQIEILLNLIDKLQKDLENLKEVERQICCEELITKDKYQDILKENAELKEELENACKENDELIKENHKHIDYIADMKKKHEDKIRAKIKELEEKYKKHEKEGLYGFVDKLDIGTRIDVLRELLGE